MRRLWMVAGAMVLLAVLGLSVVGPLLLGDRWTFAP